MNEKIIVNQQRIYAEAFAKHGATPRGTYQNNTETQYLRYERLIKNIKEYLHGDTIHDVGAGVCDLHRYLLANKIDHQYSGTEIVQEMIEYSLREYPGIKLYNRNLLTVTNERYDYTLLSGTLNLVNKIDKKAWKKYSYDLIRKMFTISSKAMAFNFLTTYNTFNEDDLMYFNPCEMLDYCITKLSRFVSIDHNYPLYEATITVFKKEFLRSIYQEESFDKYFVN
jgi:hypothetical protein